MLLTISMLGAISSLGSIFLQKSDDNLPMAELLKLSIAWNFWYWVLANFENSFSVLPPRNEDSTYKSVKIRTHTISSFGETLT